MQKINSGIYTKPTLRKQSSLKYLLKYKWLYLFILPGALTVFIFNYVPLWGLIMAFQNFEPTKGVWGSSFSGLSNFKDVFIHPDFIRIMRNTLAISGLGFIIGFPLPILVALLINEVRSLKYKKIIQTISYLPHFISWVVVAGIMYEFLNTRGLVNNLIALVGLPRTDFFADPKLFWIVSVLISVWKELGWACIIYLAAIAGVDQELYEAAVVDGANRLQRIWNITIPGIKPTIALLLILTAGSIFTGAGISPGFDGIFNLMNPVLGDYAQTLDIWIYQEGIYRGSYSFTTAMGLMLAVISFILVYVANKSANKIDDLGIL